jgi:hypothetical protein
MQPDGRYTRIEGFLSWTVVKVRFEGKAEAKGSGRQSCNLTGESPVMPIAHVGHVAIPQPGAGNQPG